MRVLYYVLATCLLLPAMPAWSALSCSISPNPLVLRPVYTDSGQTLQGTLDLTCTRSHASDEKKPQIWIGLDQTTAGRTVNRVTGGSTIDYEVFHGSATQGTWTGAGTDQGPGSTNDGPVVDTLDFGTGNSFSVVKSYNFWLQVPGLQNPGAGEYRDAIPISLRVLNVGGAVITTATLDVIITVPRVCRFSTAPTPININYQAFSPSAVTGSSQFGMTCTQGTTYTMSLDKTRSVVPGVELAYGLNLSAGSATGTAQAQPYSVNISVDPGQPGRCNAAVCTGTDTRTLTVTY